VKKQWVLMGLAVTFAAGMYLGTTVNADTGGAEPGSIDDPIVTKSYVDEKLQQIQPGSGGGVASASLKVVALQPGQSLIAFEGTEFIARGGKLVAIASASGGIPNVTAGKDLSNGTAIPLNHLLLFPRSDERGIRFDANSKGTAVIMVRGAYEIRNPDGSIVPQTP
jgi:hypothetical protein